MKHTLEALLATVALSTASCATIPKNLHYANSIPDGKYDSVDDLINPEEVRKLADANYMVISEVKYKTPEGEEFTLHNLGTAVIYKSIGSKTYLATANHFVQKENVLVGTFKGKLVKVEKVSEQFYLLEDKEVDMFHNAQRKLSGSEDKQETTQKFYLEDPLEKKDKQFYNILHTSGEIDSLFGSVKPRKIEVVAKNETKDLAVISVPKLKHQPLSYSIGNPKELERQNLLVVVGFPEGLFKTITRGYVTSVSHSRLLTDDSGYAFAFDAPISSGSSGGGIFAVRDGKLELVGITSAMNTKGNDIYIGAKINGISEVFKGDSLYCIKSWECNPSSVHKLKL